jgi:hypothetical protein
MNRPPWPTPAERVARDATAATEWAWTDDDLAPARGIANAIFLSLLIIGVPVLVWAAL